MQNKKWLILGLLLVSTSLYSPTDQGTFSDIEKFLKDILPVNPSAAPSTLASLPKHIPMPSCAESSSIASSAAPSTLAPPAATSLPSIENLFKKHQCPNCNKAFRRNDHLTQHINTVHKKERNHLCFICNQAFGEKGHLTKHEQSQKHKDALLAFLTGGFNAE